MASPTAIPNPEKSAHYRHKPSTVAPVDLSSEIRTSEGQRLSFSPPVSYYSRSSAPATGLRIPTGMTSTMGPSSPTNRFSMGFSPTASKNDDARMSPPQCHTRARSQTTIGAGTIASSTEPWDAGRIDTRSSALSDSVGSQSSSFVSASDLSFSRSPTSPTSSLSSSAAAGYSLGRVPSLPLGASYEQAQKRFNSGSWGQKMGWMGSMRSNPLSPTLTRTSIDEGSAVGDANANTNGPMGGLLRRFSLSGNSYRAPSTSVSSNAPVAPAFETAPNAAAIPRSASPKTIPVTRDSGVCFSERMDEPKPVARGRQPSFSGNTKRKPSPMGERLLMGHFNAH
ncbi:uncharacterized protein PAN0_010c3930 [Moesziomyces antarcticus]|uniref:Uncharacterized protein n=2 Tax=Pseudozyma antarctica TaxID=84753 RepID=A0A081CGB4_PSEA2|nr:uncharacterized protein PAN0_010c3930 [Moesziomyces antarcticus]GAK65710.1 conserved hypothetical protein [Moesziomyces antarcticus]SPO45337.1 uncharacterized protein PSANT_03023 [Moesziomyces antarcticus]